MPSNRVTQNTIKALKSPPRGNSVVWDAGSGSVTGFGVRITAAGSISFVLRYVIDGRERRMTLGKFPDLTIAVARELAAKHRSKVAVEGRDPLEERSRRLFALTISNLAKLYLEHHASTKSASAAEDDASMLRDYVLPSFGEKRVSELSSMDVGQLHRSMRDTPYRANRVLALLSKMLSKGSEWSSDADPSILKSIRKYPEEKRDRWLSSDELRSLTQALDRHPNQRSANAIRLLLLTGARRSEVLSAEWQEFDLERKIWTKPTHHTKQRKRGHFPLSVAAMKLLEKMKSNAASEYLFPSPTNGSHQIEIKTFWRTICSEAGLEQVRVHDLRHTFASHLVSSGHSLEMVGRLLGHTQAATTFRYAHVADDPLRAATNHIGNLMESVTLGDQNSSTSSEPSAK